MTETKVHDYRAGIPKGHNMVFMWDPRIVDGIDRNKMSDFQAYGQRALIPARRGDLVYINATPSELRKVRNQVEYLNTLGYGPIPNDVRAHGKYIEEASQDAWLRDPQITRRIVDEIESKMGGHGTLNPYFYQPRFRELAQKAGIDYMGPKDHTIAQTLSDKDSFHHWVRDNTEIDIGPFEVVKGNVKDSISRLFGSPEYKQSAFCRGAKSASAMGQFGVVNPGNLEAKAAEMEEELAFVKSVLVQPNYGDPESPSITYRITDEGVYQLTPVSDQMLDKKSHMGNLIPLTRRDYHLEEQMERDTLQMAIKAYEQGYRGDIGFDMMVIEGNGAIPAEANTRPTGNNATAIVHYDLSQLDGRTPFVTSFNLSTDHRDFDRIKSELGSLLITDKVRQDYGVIPVAIGRLHDLGKVSFVGVGESPEARFAAANEAATRFNDQSILNYLESLGE